MLLVFSFKENKHGEIIVSKLKADVKALWKIFELHSRKTPVDGTITKIIKGGYD